MLHREGADEVEVKLERVCRSWVAEAVRDELRSETGKTVSSRSRE